MTQSNEFFYKQGMRYMTPTYDVHKEAKHGADLGWYYHFPTKTFYKWKDLPKDK